MKFLQKFLGIERLSAHFAQRFDLQSDYTAKRFGEVHKRIEELENQIERMSHVGIPYVDSRTFVENLPMREVVSILVKESGMKWRSFGNIVFEPEEKQ